MLSEKTKKTMEEWEKRKKFTVYNNPMLFAPFAKRDEKFDEILSKFLPKNWSTLVSSQKKSAITGFVNRINDYYYFKGMPLHVSFVRAENLPNIIDDYSDEHIFLLARNGVNEIIVNEDLLSVNSQYLNDYVVPENYMENIFPCAVLEKLIYECENIMQEMLLRLVRSFIDTPPEFTQLSFTLFVDNIINELRERNITYIGTTMCEYNLGLKYSPAMIRLHTLNNTFIRRITRHIFTLVNAISEDKNFDKYTNTIVSQCEKNDKDVVFVGGHIVTEMLKEKIKILLGYMTIAKTDEQNLDDGKKLALTPYHDIWIGTRNFVDELYKIETTNYEIQKQTIKQSAQNENKDLTPNPDNETNSDGDSSQNIDDDNQGNEDTITSIQNDKHEENSITSISVADNIVDNKEDDTVKPTDVTEAVNYINNDAEVINSSSDIDNYDNKDDILTEHFDKNSNDNVNSNAYDNHNKDKMIKDSYYNTTNNINNDLTSKFNQLNTMADKASKYSLRRITKINKLDKE